MISNTTPVNTTDPAFQAANVVPSDATDLSTGGMTPRAIYVGTGGNVALIAQNSATGVIFKNVPSGTTLSVRPRQVLATGTTAGDIIALY